MLKSFANCKIYQIYIIFNNTHHEWKDDSSGSLADTRRRLEYIPGVSCYSCFRH